MLGGYIFVRYVNSTTTTCIPRGMHRGTVYKVPRVSQRRYIQYLHMTKSESSLHEADQIIRPISTNRIPTPATFLLPLDHSHSLTARACLPSASDRVLHALDSCRCLAAPCLVLQSGYGVLMFAA